MSALFFALDRLKPNDTPWMDGHADINVHITDRHVLSSAAYQGRTVDRDWIMEINRFAPVPDITFFLDVPAYVAASRDTDDHDYQSIIDSYWKSIELYGAQQNVVVIDGDRPVTQVAEEIRLIVESKLPEWREGWE